MTNNILVFDRDILRQKRNRCAPHLNEHGFLIDRSMNQITERLAEIKRKFPTSLQIGARTTFPDKERFGIKDLYTLDIAEKLSPKIQADEEYLPFAAESFNLIISPLNLHTINDLPGSLAQIKRALKPDGLFMATLFGGETLHELRTIMSKAEIEIKNGISPRIAPFADMQQMGALMQRAGFTLPVIDSEKITVTYDHPSKLMKDLRYMGESNALLSRSKKAMGKEFLNKIYEQYSNHFSEKSGLITATFDIIFLTGWSPHESQQKPLRPGTAQNKLAEALNVNEGILPC